MIILKSKLTEFINLFNESIGTELEYETYIPFAENYPHPLVHISYVDIETRKEAQEYNKLIERFAIHIA